MASTSISKTYSSAGNRQKWTWSAWIKRSSLTSASNGQTLWNCEGSSASDNFIFQIDGGGGTGGPTDSLGLHTYGNDAFRTTPLLRDTNGWYHIVFALDTTQATATDRIKLYVNGTLQSYSQETNFPTQNYEMGINRAAKHCIGSHGTNANYYFDGYMSHIHFCDGYQYAASDFGETDSNGVWKINTSPSVSYGTNGFFILKDGNSLTDESPNSNDFSSNGGTLTNMKDNPSNVFATWGTTTWIDATLTHCNTSIDTEAGGNYAFNASTLAFTKGKFYWENKITSTSTDMFGISGRYEAGDVQNELGQFADQYAFNTEDGTIRNNNSNSSFGSSCNTNGNIVQIAIDCDNLKMYVGVNGTWQNSGDPTSGATGTGAYSIGALSTTKDGVYFPAIGDWSSGSASYETNFGNGYFGQDAVASAGTNASDIGIFEYDVPTGYTALSTKGLNL